MAAPVLAPPTLQEGIELIAVAWRELKHAGRDLLKRRQAAEKGWLAARTIAGAIFAQAGEDWQDGADVPGRMRRLEQRLDPAYLRRLGRKPPSLPLALRVARDSLHGQCFYNKHHDACRVDEIEENLKLLEAALPRARRLYTLASRRGR